MIYLKTLEGDTHTKFFTVVAGGQRQVKIRNTVFVRAQLDVHKRSLKPSFEFSAVIILGNYQRIEPQINEAYFKHILWGA